MTRPAGLILDYGNLLTHAQDQAWMDGAALRLGADPAAFRAAYWQHRHAYDADLSAAEYWGRLLTTSRPDAGALDAVDLGWLIQADIASWSVYHDDVWALAAAFRRTGGRTAFLSNSGPEVMARVRARWPLEARFDAVVISCEVGLSKPDPRIYRLCLDRLGLPAPETLFVDDRADNIEGAACVGLEPSDSRAPTRSSGCRPWSAERSRPRGWPIWEIPFWAWRNTSGRKPCGASLRPRFADAGPVAWLLRG